MKKFIVLFIIIGSIFAGVVFYDPHLKPYVDPWLAKIMPADLGPEADDGEKPDPGSTGTKAPKPQPAPASTPVASTNTLPPKPAAPAAPPVEPLPLSEIDRILQQKYPLPKILPLMQIVDNWNNVPPNAFPTEVALKVRVGFTIPGVGASVAVPGTLVQPARFDNPSLTVASLGNRAMRATLNVDETDFKDRIQQRYNDFVVNSTEKVREQRAKARKVLMEQPEAVAAATTTTWDSADDPRFAPVKASLEANDLRSVRPEEATAFRWSGTQKVRGSKHKGTYETVTVSFEVDTIFGMFPTEWMALLENGKVVGWVDPITHEGSAL